MDLDPTITAALVTGVFGLVVPLVTFLRGRIYSSLGLGRLQKGRRTYLTGKWSGNVNQDIGCPAQNGMGILTITLKAGSHRIEGSGEFVTPTATTTVLLLGGLINDSIVSLNYQSDDGGRVQTGALICILSSDGKRLNGRYVGYGPFSEGIVSGAINLTKR